MTLFLLAAGVTVTVGLSRLEPAAPSVPSQLVVMGTVERGTMLRQVRAPGTLAAMDIVWITAATDGRITSLPLQPGTRVETDTVILQTANPELEKETEDAKWSHASAEAELRALEERLQNQHLDLESSLAELQAAYKDAQLQLDVDNELFQHSLISKKQHLRSQGSVEQLQNRLKIAKEKVKNNADSIEPQLDVQRSKVRQALSLYTLKRNQLANLSIRAGTTGILQQLGEDPQAKPLAVGQWVLAGTPLAMITNPKRLKAELKVPEIQARDIVLNQVVEIDARLAKIPGRVIRIDPAARQGTVTIDVRLEGELPAGARPDLSVNGTVLIEKLEDVLYTKRILYSEPGSTVSLFKFSPDEGIAYRVPVTLGRSSVHTIEIVDGLEEGDQIIIGDMNKWDEYDAIRLP